MDIDSIAKFLVETLNQFAWGAVPLLILSGFGSMVTLTTIIVALTKTPKDDQKLAELRQGSWGKVINLLEKFSVIKRKDS